MVWKRVALCMLTYNCGADLERILSLITSEQKLTHNSFFDDILILDGGSTDNTIEVAKKYSVQLFIKIGSFPAAEGKNYLATHTLSDYILFWDSDELFPLSFLKNLQKITSLGHLCYRFPRLNLPDMSGWPDYQVRLYRNRDCIWKRSVHEIVIHKETGKPADQIDTLTLYQYPIIHFPGTLFQRLNRFRRNINLLIEELKKNSEEFTLDDIVKETNFLIEEIQHRYKDQECEISEIRRTKFEWIKVNNSMDYLQM